MPKINLIHSVERLYLNELLLHSKHSCGGATVVMSFMPPCEKARGKWASNRCHGDGSHSSGLVDSAAGD